MAGGGRISRVHGPFVADGEVEKIVAHLKTQGQPEYLDAITNEDDAGRQRTPTGRRQAAWTPRKPAISTTAPSISFSATRNARQATSSAACLSAIIKRLPSRADGAGRRRGCAQSFRKKGDFGWRRHRPRCFRCGGRGVMRHNSRIFPAAARCGHPAIRKNQYDSVFTWLPKRTAAFSAKHRVHADPCMTLRPAAGPSVPKSSMDQYSTWGRHAHLRSRCACKRGLRGSLLLRLPGRAGEACASIS